MKTKSLLTVALSLCICVAYNAQSLPSYLPSDGLVGWWPFNGNANDESGNGYDGVVNGPTLSTDRFGNAASAYQWSISLPNQSQIEIGPVGNSLVGSSISISAWFYMDGGNGDNPRLIDFGSNYAGIWTLGTNANNRVLGGFWPPSGGYFITNYYSTSEWHHLVYTSDVSNGLTNVYIDGELDTSFCCSQFDPSTPYTGIWKIGGMEPTDYWGGKIDDLAIWNIALSGDQVQSLYTGEPVNPPTACNPLPTNLQNGLVGYWPFCGNANDESGNGHDGIATGVTLTEDRFGSSGQAYNWDYNSGDNQYISIGSMQSNFSSGSFSLSTWIYADSGRGANPRIINFGNVHPGAWSLGSSNQSRSYTIFWPPSGGIVHTNAVSSLSWHHLVFTADFPSGMTRVYVDGDLDSSFCCTVNDPSSPIFGSWEFGRKPPTEVWGGKLDDIGIWNRALSAEEVQQLYTLNACTFTVYDTVTVENVVTVYDTVSVSLSTTDTLIIETLITAVQPAQENTFLVYPNPAHTQITINNGNYNILGGYSLRITNSAGQEVYNQSITQPEVTLNLGSWGGNGLYILYINDPSNNTIAVKQIVLQ